MDKKNIDYALIVAAMGRCGSTLMFNALKPYFAEHKFEQNLKSEYRPKELVKTHDFAPQILKNCKVIYMFGDPRDIIVSVHSKGRVDIPRHYANMHAKFNRNFVRRNVFAEKDTLRLSDNFHSWHKSHNYPIITVQYEFLYENIDKISEFLGFELKMPPKKPRKTNWRTHACKDKIRATYEQLHQEIKNSAECTVWGINNNTPIVEVKKKIVENTIDVKENIVENKIKAIMLTVDHRMNFAHLTTKLYNSMWPNHPFEFHIPYNSVEPKPIDNVRYVKTPKLIKDTIKTLLHDIEDDEFVYWCTDDRYSVKLRSDIIQEIVQKLPNIDADSVRLISFPHKIKPATLSIKNVQFFRCQNNYMPRGFWHHQFIRAKILKKVFLETNIKDNYNHMELNNFLIKKARQYNHKIFVPNVDLIVLGEPVFVNKISPDCVKKMEELGLEVPKNMEYTKKSIYYGNIK